MTDRRHRAATLQAMAIPLAIVQCLAAALSGVRAEVSVGDTLRFAAEMAEQGNWREARYRWDQAATREPDNPRLLNNRAVAAEAMGDVAAAQVLYDRAAALSGDDPRVTNNRRRFQRFWREALAHRAGSEGDGSAASAEQDSEDPANPAGRPSDKIKGKGKALKVQVKLPVPARLDLAGVRTLLVASFLTEDSELIDSNRELVRFLRSEFRKKSGLQVLDITPPPAVPEQTIEDLLANAEFWKHLGRQYGADLIVSGVLTYERRDTSGFQTVDLTSPSTGQKVRRTQWVEQEQFVYELDIFFMDGAAGTLRFRDRLQRGATFRGQQNDPITAFFDLSETIAADVLAVVNPSVREDTRFIFKS